MEDSAAKRSEFSGNWWEIFQDSQLNALEAEVNVSNQNLKAAEAQYTQARAALRYQRADYYPGGRSSLSTATHFRESATPQPTIQRRYFHRLTNSFRIVLPS